MGVLRRSDRYPPVILTIHLNLQQVVFRPSALASRIRFVPSLPNRAYNPPHNLSISTNTLYTVGFMGVIRQWFCEINTLTDDTCKD